MHWYFVTLTMKPQTGKLKDITFMVQDIGPEYAIQKARNREVNDSKDAFYKGHALQVTR